MIPYTDTKVTDTKVKSMFGFLGQDKKSDWQTVVSIKVLHTSQVPLGGSSSI